MKAVATRQISFRVDDYTKREAEIILNGIGISMSSALTIFLRQVVARRGIPMELSYDSLTDPQKIEQARIDYANGRKNYHFHELPPLSEEHTIPEETSGVTDHAETMV